MFRQYFDDNESISPAKLELLQSVLVDLCRESGIEPASPHGNQLASSLIALFKSGFRSREELLFMTRDAAT
ncbi:hypothetical protein [Rhizobium sp. 18065]|uniref:hypothetical protein n=1 Tax=Rhizobium sp. 18065 TaxID=2681411 RepID=UPI0013574B8E|nr:hypothetical protein [Rhizobium sp. 18065]